MKTIIATIKPLHLGNIRRGIKLYEIRKTCPVDTPFRVLCCESGSGGEIKAEFEVMSPMKIYPEQCTDMVNSACVKMDEAMEYADGKELWFWDISNMIDYCSTKGYRVRNISEFGLKRPPQSWQYVKDEEND